MKIFFSRFFSVILHVIIIIVILLATIILLAALAYGFYLKVHHDRRKKIDK